MKAYLVHDFAGVSTGKRQLMLFQKGVQTRLPDPGDMAPCWISWLESTHVMYGQIRVFKKESIVSILI